MLMDKSEIPVVSVEEMNTTHQNEVDLINKLYELINNSLKGEPAGDELAATIEQFRTSVEQHFSREEEMMREAGFPALTVHKGEHDRVRAELFGIIEGWRNTGDLTSLAHYLENVHPGWAKNHIATMDNMTAMYIMQARARV